MRLLICTFYFPPCTITPANRTFSWAKYLNQFGIYPVIITRHWPTVFSEDLYEERSVGQELVIEKHSNYEVHFVPFKGNYITRSLQKHGHLKNKMPRRIFVVFELLFRNLFHQLLPYSNIFTYALDYMGKNKVDKVLISASPFQLFKIGFWAKKKYNIPWIADYRDGWTRSNHSMPQGILGKLEGISNRYFEKKWMRTADKFITVSPYLKKSIEDITGVKGFEIYNGFYTEDTGNKTVEADKTSISFLYNGTMYASQDYNSVVRVMKKLIDGLGDKIDIKVYFLGTGFKNETFSNDPVFTDFSNNFILLDRVTHWEALKIQQKADVFLMLSYRGAKGITTSKIFDYIKFHKPVILFPNDFDIVEELLTRSGLGIIADDLDMLEEKMTRLVTQKMNEGFIKLNAVDEIYISSFSRENQARKLAEIIKN